jgi:hypothetical protein
MSEGTPKTPVIGKVQAGVGLDVGTAFIVGARQVNDKVELRSIRDAYFAMPRNKIMEKLLTKSSLKDNDEENKHGGAGFLELQDKIIVIGEKALAYASCTHGEMCRPMNKGVLSPDENAEKILSVIIEKVIGKPKVPNEICRFSVPAEPFDEDIDIIFHEGMIMAILKDLGYEPKCLNEGEAVCYSELASDGLSGGAFSMGGGQSNGCVIFEGRPVISFSIARGGDWIDQMSYKHARMKSAAEMTQFKETHEIDILNPKGREEMALATYYRHHVKYMISAVSDLLEKEGAKVPAFLKPVKWVISGGTSLAKNCIPMIRQEFEQNPLPFKISEIVHAAEPLMATAKGCLVAALLDHAG